MPRLIALVLLLVAPAFPALISIHEPAEVTAHAAFVVLADIDHGARTARIVRTLRGDIDAEVLEIANLNDIGGEAKPEGKHRAFLFLDRVDRRYFLLRRKNPRWIGPQSAIVYVRGDRVLGWRTRISGVLERLDIGGLTEFRVRLGAWLRAPRVRSPFRPELSAADAKRWRVAQGDNLDGHARRIRNEPYDVHETLTRLHTFARASQGEALRRAIEAHLMLTHPKTPTGSIATRRRKEAYRALAALLKRVPRDLAVATLLDELRSVDYDAGHEAAARALRAYSRAWPEAKTILLAHMRAKDGTLASRAYFALRALGFRADADRARAKSD